MVARLLNLEEAERRRGYDRDDDMRYGQGHLGKHSRDGDSWNENIAGHRKANLGKEPLGSGKWNRHGEEVIQTYAECSVAPLSQTLTIPQSELKAISGKKGKSDPVLPVSKWSQEDDSSDEENKKGARDLGLSYSSSGSENAGDGHENADEAEVDTEVGVLVHSDCSMNEDLGQKLRRLEVAVMEYRESLGERGIRSSEEIEKKVAIHRKRLQSEFGLLSSTEVTNKHSSQRTSIERKERVMMPMIFQGSAIAVRAEVAVHKGSHQIIETGKAKAIQIEIGIDAMRGTDNMKQKVKEGGGVGRAAVERVTIMAVGRAAVERGTIMARIRPERRTGKRGNGENEQHQAHSFLRLENRNIFIKGSLWRSYMEI